MQVIGCVFNNPRYLDYTDKYTVTEDDFTDEFHKIAFGSIYKVYQLGANEITLRNINDFLSTRPKSKAIYDKNKGDEWLLKVSEAAQDSSFDYYYNRLKKFTLLRAYNNIGLDLSDIYDADNILDTKKRQQQEEMLDNASLVSLSEIINNKIDVITAKYVHNSDTSEIVQAGEGARELIEKLKDKPNVGYPLFGPLINTVTRGARLSKFYLRSGGSGTGKSRAMAADACWLACSQIYDPQFGWINTGKNVPTMLITTELQLDEVQTMMIAFISNVNEEHIQNSLYVDGEWERVQKALDILEEAPLRVKSLPDFSIQDIEDAIKQGIREYGLKAIFHDYIFSSLKILEEIATKSKGVKLREDNVLFMLSTRLKDLCNEYGVFILSATQLSGDFRNSETPDQTLLRGSKAVADKIDVGMHILEVTNEDLVKLEQVLAENIFDVPKLKISVYKNRGNRWKSMYLWCKADLGTCRIEPQFATTWNYELIQIDDIRINIKDETEESAF